MKNSIFFLLLFFSSTSIFAQDAAYQQAMGQALGQYGAAESPEEFENVANTFERIGAQAATEYLPHYYAALVQINSSFQMREADARDKLIDQALENLKKANEASPNNDEIEVLNGYALMARMVVDPASRAPQYSGRIMQSFGKAMQMDPNNPRAAAMMARQELGTAQYFGSDKAKACGLAAQSLALFEAEKPEGFEPSWGKNVANEVIASCE